MMFDSVADQTPKASSSSPGLWEDYSKNIERYDLDTANFSSIIIIINLTIIHHKNIIYVF